jgi:hypothetical protein
LVIEELVSIFSFGHWRTCQHLFLWSLKNLSISFPLVIEELVSIFSFGHWRIIDWTSTILFYNNQIVDTQKNNWVRAHPQHYETWNW